MSLRYSFGRADSRLDIARTVQFAANNAESYETVSHRQWAFNKLRPRLESGQAGASLVCHDDLIVAVGIVYVSRAADGSMAIEQKFLRTLDHFADQGLGRLMMRQSVVTGAEMLGAAPGDDLHYHLDTRADNLAARRFFENVGCTLTGSAALYTSDAIDISYEMTVHAPRTTFTI